MSRYYRSILNVQATAIDPDAQAFLTAAGIVDATITSAINNLVVGLKGASLWAKMKAIYPFVGGTATTHKFNLKDPRDLDVAFRLTFFGGLTHSTNGVEGNGTNGYANTHFNNNVDLSTTNLGYDVSLFSASTINNSIFLGNLSSPGATSNSFLLHNTTGNSYRMLSSGNFQPVVVTSAFTVVRNISNIYRSVNDGSIDTQVEAAGTPLNADTFILAGNLGGTAINFSDAGLNFSLIAEGLTSAEIPTLQGLRNTFNTALGR